MAIRPLSMLIAIAVLATTAVAPHAARADDVQYDKELLDLGGKLYKGAKMQKADVKITKAIKREPDNADLYVKRAISMNKQKNYEQAIKDCDRAILLNAKSAVAYEQRGYAYDRISDYERSVPDFDRAIQLDPTRRDAYFGIVRLDGRRRTYIHGVDYLNKFLKLNPNDTEALRYRGDFYSHLKLKKQCFDDLNKAISLQPKDGHNYQYLARGYYKFNDAANGLKYNDIALKLLPRDPGVLIDRGMILVLRGDYENALKQYEKAISLDPHNHQAYNEKGIVLAQMGRQQESNLAFDKAIQLDDRHRNIYYANHAKVSAKFGNLDDALADVQAMRRSEGKTALGTIFDTKTFAQTIAQYSKLITLSPKKSEHYYDRGVAYVCNADNKLAIADFEQFLKLSQGHDETTVCAVTLKAVCLRRLKREPEAIKCLTDYAPRFPAESWEKTLLDALLGKSSYKNLLSSSEKLSKVISAKCFAGLWLLPSSQSEQGKEYLRAVVESGARHLDEYSLASSSLHPPHPAKTTAVK
ncbi:MAG: tetratricopeptide repeat protein [Cyanobacteria bacterium SZAS-4]|nr:tetratricopeptide repeat protein [Cyanobacteria bacterium SZAS-4]